MYFSGCNPGPVIFCEIFFAVVLIAVAVVVEGLDTNLQKHQKLREFASEEVCIGLLCKGWPLSFV